MKMKSVRAWTIGLALARIAAPAPAGTDPMYVKLAETAPFGRDMKALLDSIRTNTAPLDIARIDVAKGRVVGVEYRSSSRFLLRTLEDLVHPVLSEDGWNSGLVNSYFHHVLEPLPEFLPAISSHHGYFRNCGGSGDVTEFQGWRAYLFHRMDRSLENVGALWNASKGAVFGLVSAEVYVRNDFQRTVDALLASDRHIRSLRDGATRLERSWNDVVEESRGDWTQPCSGPEWANGIDTGLKVSNRWDIDENWVASFWMRRHHEGNRDVVRSILLEIQKHYQDLGIAALVRERDRQKPNPYGQGKE